MRFFRKKKRSSSLLGIGDPGRDLDLELIGKTEEAVEAVEGDMSDVLDVGWPSDLHVMDGGDYVLGWVHPARHHRFSDGRQEKRHQRQLVLLLFFLLGGSRRPRPLPAAAASTALGHHDHSGHSISLSLRGEQDWFFYKKSLRMNEWKWELMCFVGLHSISFLYV